MKHCCPVSYLPFFDFKANLALNLLALQRGISPLSEACYLSVLS
jgi:hypothetical protein